ncbi:MAG: hypothetical protein V4547_18385 [Bacteroidota bacterium]
MRSHRLTRSCLHHKKRIVGTFVILFVVVYLFKISIILAIRDLIYLLRPIWDRPPNIPENLIAHYYAPGIPPEKLCKAHNWTIRNLPDIPRVFDVFIFSIELDLLEIRLKELWSVVDKFVLVEADKTFTGKPKRLYFKENRERFEWAKEKLVYYTVTSLYSNPTKDFQNEAKLRGYMTGFVNQEHPDPGDLIIIGDIDELPYAHTIQLLKSCEGYSQELHLEMNNYLYSFEFLLKTTNWKPHVAIYDPNSFWYHHGKYKSSYRLADAGWHCSFCFRYISDFIFKMTSYSHSDRVTSKRLLDESEIQRKICEGLDIFDMLPEAYTYKELISQMGSVPKRQSTIGIPQHILENLEKFSFLLPGGCTRDKNT